MFNQHARTHARALRDDGMNLSTARRAVTHRFGGDVMARWWWGAAPLCHIKPDISGNLLPCVSQVYSHTHSIIVNVLYGGFM